jgi:hypothetical protein
MSSYSTARKLADEIVAYWRQRGHTAVNTWVVAEGVAPANDNEKERVIYGVRSNLVNGFPPRKDAA